jgi:DDE family transposase
MFFRLKQSPSGRVLQLLESYRNPEGQPRHRVVISLGDAALAQADWKTVAAAVSAELYGQKPLLPPELSATAQRWIDSITRRVMREGRWLPLRPTLNDPQAESLDGVLVDQVTHGQSAVLGPVLLAKHAWEALGLPAALSALGFNPKEQALAAASVINRLVEPLSEHALRDWLPGTALPELLGEGILKGDPNRFYYVSDALLRQQMKLEAHLRAQQARLFNYPRTILLYDLTNTHFEGQARVNPKAKRGKNKQGRSDCPQVVVGMVYDEHGFEMAHRTFAGNQSDSTSLVEMVQSLQRAAGYPESTESLPLGTPPVLVIVDAGVGTAANVKLLAEANFRYLVNDSRRGRKKWQAEFAQDALFQPVAGREHKSQVRIRSLDIESKERLVLCKSEGRREKELAIRSGAEKKFLDGLEKLHARLQQGRLTDVVKAQRALGKLLERAARVQRFYRVDLKDAADLRAGLTWQRKDEVRDEEDPLLGCYVLRTDRSELSPERLWELYILLSRAEDGFSWLKGDLGLRPNFHHLEGRVDAHIFITVLAYQLLRFITYTLEQKDDHRDWPTLRRVLQTHCYATLNLPTRNGSVVHVRQAGAPERCHQEIYEKFGIDWKQLPKQKITAAMKTPATL